MFPVFRSVLNKFYFYGFSKFECVSSEATVQNEISSIFEAVCNIMCQKPELSQNIDLDGSETVLFCKSL